jgi:hypothetical protein
MYELEKREERNWKSIANKISTSTKGKTISL